MSRCTLSLWTTTKTQHARGEVAGDDDVIVRRHCGADDGSVVSAHSNWSEHGKGMSIKAHDVFVAHLCFACHGWLDQGWGPDPSGSWSGDEKRAMFQRAMERTWLRLWQQGRVRVAA